MSVPPAAPDGPPPPPGRRTLLTHPAVAAVAVLVGYGLVGLLWAGNRDARDNSFCGDGETAYFWVGTVAFAAVVCVCGMLANSRWNHRAVTALVVALAAVVCAPALWLTWLAVSVATCLTF